MSDITEKKYNVDDFLKKAEEIQEGYLFAMFTDMVWVEKWPLNDGKKEEFRKKEPLLLEVRVFSEDREDKLFRGDIGRDFRWRLIKDTARSDFFDEVQYLNLDKEQLKKLFKESKKVKENQKVNESVSDGRDAQQPLGKGGTSCMKAKVQLRNYIDYHKETGQAYVKDWRLVRFFQEEEKDDPI